MAFATIVTEGNLIPTDLLERLTGGDLPGQRPADFGLSGNSRITDEIETAWADARAFWVAFQRYLRRLAPNSTGTSETREHWITPLLESLGYKLTYMPQAEVVDGRTFEISHRAGADQTAPPVVVVGIGLTLDKRPPTGRPRLSPHALLQEYLNSTEHLWGIVTNGERLRLLRDSSLTTRPTYVEFDLRAMLEGEKYTEFALLYRLLHRSRLPEGMADVSKCLLEQYHQQAVDAGGRVREGLRLGVEQALVSLGNGFLEHPRNTQLRQAFSHGDLTSADYYRELLLLVYRLLFLMVGEERRLIANLGETDSQDATTPNPAYRQSAVYNDFYSVTRLRRMAEQPAAGRGSHSDLWQGLLTTFRLLEDDKGASVLGISPLDGDLFGPKAIRSLQETHLYNSVLLRTIRALSLYTDPETKSLRRVNYAALNVEELGSVYESLLDFRPVVNIAARTTGYQAGPFQLVSGTDRKTTGSYYTRSELVQELIKSALEPVLQDRLAQAGNGQKDREEAILSIKVCDPACGSGAFLLAAARRLGQELARVKYGEDQPSPQNFQRAIRSVISRCIYGVDYNPLAVDLCKLSLWLEGHSSGLPLSFLDSHIRWGNSLVGAWRNLVEAGIPDEAYNAVTGDDKAVASAYKKRNKDEQKNRKTGQLSLNFDSDLDDNREKIVKADYQLETMPDLQVAEVRAKQQEYSRLQEAEHYERNLFNLWTAAFFLPLTSMSEATTLTTTLLDRYKQARFGTNINGLLMQNMQTVAGEMGFFHWELEFPSVFDRGGFDVVLGNPPWERIKLQEEEHFVDEPYILEASNKAERTRRIDEFRKSSDGFKRARIEKFETAKHHAEAESRFMRASKRFPLTAVGDVNTYALFAEHDRNLVNPKGRAGIIVPTGIATDDTTKAFFGDLNQQKNLVSLFDFENREAIFPGVHRSYKFSLLTMGDTKKKPTQFTFFATNTTHLKDEFRAFNLTAEEIALLNPNTLTCPVFRTGIDAELTKKIYRRVPVLVNERTSQNPWGAFYMRFIDQGDHAEHLRFTLEGSKSNWNVPVYEAKLFWFYDHRFNTFENLNLQSYVNGQPREVTEQEKQNSNLKTTTRYFVPEKLIQTLFQKYSDYKKPWNLLWRDITNSTNERTCVATAISRVASTRTCPGLGFNTHENGALLLANLNSLVFDYIARQKIGGIHLNFTLMQQLPVLSPAAFNETDQNYISERVLELVYTASDMTPFGADVWAELDSGARERVLRRWEECYLASGLDYREHEEYLAKLQNSLSTVLNSSEPPPPFIWNEGRRANIRAELDAKIARLYGLTRDELRYILDPQDVYGPDFPGETFRVLKEKEIKQYGEYRTRRLVLEKWDSQVD